MKKLLLVTLLLLTISKINAQNTLFKEESNVVTFMDGKTYFNPSNGLVIEYGYISQYNTYGIKVKNKNGLNFYFINVNISPYGSFADLNGISPENGANFGFRLYRSKLIVGYGNENAVTFYLR